MKVSDLILVAPQKDLRGRIVRYVANCGELDAYGETAEAARNACAALVLAVLSDRGEPFVMIDPADGHVWIAYRLGAQWVYGHARNGRISGITIGWDSRSECIVAMSRHFRSLHEPTVAT